MHKKMLPYREGDWFAVPLREGGYALGLAARVSPPGAILGYFFGPRRTTISTVIDIQDLTPSQAIYVSKFGDLGLLEGTWLVVHRPNEWHREKWPMPDFGRIDSLDNRIAYRTTYNENRLNEAIREIRVSPEEAQSLPEEGMFGYLGLEAYLSHLLPVSPQ